ncbi:MAG: hypothetical protein M0Z69_01455 [Actinomycetota bacterium]|nr:hypothetical protein [Actinomycetota bacterium]
MGERHETLAPFGDGRLELIDALGHASPKGRRDVVGFEVHQLPIETAFEVGDLGLDLLGACMGRRGGFWLGDDFEAGPPVVSPLGSEERRGEEREQRVVEALFVQVHVRWVVGRDVLRPLV